MTHHSRQTKARQEKVKGLILPWGHREDEEPQIRYHIPDPHPRGKRARAIAAVALMMESCHSVRYISNKTNTTPQIIRKALDDSGFDFTRLVIDQYRAGATVENLHIGHGCRRVMITDILHTAGFHVMPGRGTRSPTREAVQAAVAKQGGISKAAAELGVDRSTIRRIMKGNTNVDSGDAS